MMCRHGKCTENNRESGEAPCAAGPAECRIAMVLMASGFGRRYGANKLLEEFRGEPLFVHAFRRAAESGADSICVVTRFPEIARYVESKRMEIAGQSAPPDIRVIWNEHPERGISESLRLGLSAQQEADGCCFMVCDQPLLAGETLARMFAAFRQDPDRICVCSDGSRRGNPVLFPGDFFGELLALYGDSGGRQILARHPERIREIPVGDPQELFDVDSVQDLEKCTAALAMAGKRL